jgi:hypothetical protein
MAKGYGNAEGLSRGSEEGYATEGTEKHGLPVLFQRTQRCINQTVFDRWGLP